MGDKSPEGRRYDHERGKDQNHPEKKNGAAAKSRAISGEYREAKEKHHPGRVGGGGDQARVEKCCRRGRGGKDEVEVMRQKESRKGGNEIAEKKHGKEGEQDDQQELVGEGRAKIVHYLEIDQDSFDGPIGPDPEAQGQRDEDGPPEPFFLTPSEEVVFPGEEIRRKQGGERGHKQILNF